MKKVKNFFVTVTCSHSGPEYCLEHMDCIHRLCHLVRKTVLEGSGDKYDKLEGSLYANLVLLGSLGVGTILTWLTKETLKRQDAHRSEHSLFNSLFKMVASVFIRPKQTNVVSPIAKN